MAKSNELILKFAAQKKLMVLYLVAALIIILLFVLTAWQRTAKSNFGESLQWVFNYLGPGLTLIIGAFAYTASQPPVDPPKYIHKTYFRITFYFALVYLLSITTIIAITSVAIDETETLNEYFKKFDLLLTFFQTSFLVLLSIFFARENH